MWGAGIVVSPRVYCTKCPAFGPHTHARFSMPISIHPAGNSSRGSFSIWDSIFFTYVILMAPRNKIIINSHYSAGRSWTDGITMPAQQEITPPSYHKAMVLFSLKLSESQNTRTSFYFNNLHFAVLSSFSNSLFLCLQPYLPVFCISFSFVPCILLLTVYFAEAWLRHQPWTAS